MPAKNMNKAKANHVIAANNLFNEFNANEAQANKKYMGLVIEVNGSIADISEDQKGDKVVMLKNDDDFPGVLCTLTKKETDKISSYKTGQPIKIRGICTGMLMEVVLKDCVIIE